MNTIKVSVVKISDSTTKNGKKMKVMVYNEGGLEKSILCFEPSKLRGVEPGDVINLTTEQSGKWTNFIGAEVVTKGGAPVSSSQHSYKEDPEKQKSISRAVALDKAVNLVAAFGGKIPIDKAIVDTLETAKTFYHFLVNDVQETEEDGDVPF